MWARVNFDGALSVRWLRSASGRLVTEKFHGRLQSVSEISLRHETGGADIIHGGQRMFYIAGPLRRFWNVTIPMISPTMFFNFVLASIGAVQTFEAAFVGTAGGPAYATWIYGLHIYEHRLYDRPLVIKPEPGNVGVLKLNHGWTFRDL